NQVKPLPKAQKRDAFLKAKYRKEETGKSFSPQLIIEQGLIAKHYKALNFILIPILIIILIILLFLL
ncbi:MAG: hypothetical protein ACT6RN_28040, partial [Agrobacterium sp.]|uniref:hypothetical protein n=1 Tax=Agrobacterium sp. TaxID=361 RepID=UPI004037E331